MQTKRFQIIILISLIGISVIPFTSLTIKSKDTLIYAENDIKDLEKSDFWNLTTNIYIDDSNPAFNWSTTNSTYDWCNGSGTWTDPYVIENVTVNGKGSTCIRVLNSEAYFIINNVTLFNASFRGIDLENASNGKILDSKIYNTTTGIWIQPDSNNNTISGLEIYNSSRGIELEDSINNTIEGNKIINITEVGIWMRQNSNNTWLISNYLNNMSSRGIYLNSVNNNTVFNNTVTGLNNYAIEISTSSS